MRRRAYLIALVVSGIVIARQSEGAACNQASVAVDSSLADGVLGTTIIGRAVGQSFVAPTKWIESITVWRTYQEDSLGFGIHLYVCRLDSTGTPVTYSPILNGPTITEPYGDGVHSIPFRFDFDPPLELPSPGGYAFFLQVSPCDGWSDFLACHDSYPGGCMWKTSRSLDLGCILRANPNIFAWADLAFDILFCDFATPTKRSTWGSLKVLYR